MHASICCSCPTCQHAGVLFEQLGFPPLGRATTGTIFWTCGPYPLRGACPASRSGPARYARPSLTGAAAIRCTHCDLCRCPALGLCSGRCCFISVGDSPLWLERTAVTGCLAGAAATNPDWSATRRSAAGCMLLGRPATAAAHITATVDSRPATAANQRGGGQPSRGKSGLISTWPANCCRPSIHSAVPVAGAALPSALRTFCIWNRAPTGERLRCSMMKPLALGAPSAPSTALSMPSPW